MHIDMNSYFASVEQQANPFLRGKAIGVTGKRLERSVIAAASREAKKLGVKTAMATWQAKHILPSIILVPGDPEKYAHITTTFNQIFAEEADSVERFSVDESFLDVTERAGDYFGATAIAVRIRDRLRLECGSYITASIGIAPNKMMAKLASESVKPDGLTVVPPHHVLKLLDASGLEDLCGIGPRIARRLENMGVHTFQQLREHPLDALTREFKSYGLWLHEAAHGRGDEVVCSNVPPPKSIGHSYTLPQNTTNARVAEHYLLALCEKVAWRMRRDGYLSRTVVSFVRFGDFSGVGGQMPLDEPSANGWNLFLAARALLKKHRALSSGQLQRPIRLVGISATSLVEGSEPLPLDLQKRKHVRILPALDRLQHRFGDQAWTRASLLSTNILPRTSGFAYDHEI
jgi:DNA polymerase-4